MTGFMELLPGFEQRFFGRDSIGPAVADFGHPRPDLFRPSGLDFRRGKALDAGKKLLCKLNPPRGRPFQGLLRQRFLCDRHGRIIEQDQAFGKRANGQGGLDRDRLAVGYGHFAAVLQVNHWPCASRWSR